MTKQELDILGNINEYITNENGLPVTIDSMLHECELDSFGYTVFFIDLDDEYDCYSSEYVKTLNIAELRVKDMVERIKECM